jgi:hypothetical protein
MSMRTLSRVGAALTAAVLVGCGTTAVPASQPVDEPSGTTADAGDGYTGDWKDQLESPVSTGTGDWKDTLE